MREAALKSTIFVGVPRVCVEPFIPRFLLSSAVFLFIFHVQIIGALSGLTDALEDDVKAGLRTDSRRCVVPSPGRPPTGLPVTSCPQGRQLGKHRRHHRARASAVELHLRAARRQAARQTRVVSPRLHLCVFPLLAPPIPSAARTQKEGKV
jgi:hypothetical protein